MLRLSVFLSAMAVALASHLPAFAAQQFQAATQIVAPAASVAVGDFNNDGRVDIVSAGSSSVTVLLSKGNGTFQPAISTSVSQYAEMLVAGDFNNDGKLDVAVTSTFGSGNSVTILLGNGDGTFRSSPATYSLENQASGVASGDFNGDGNMDLVVSSGNGKGVYVLAGKGDGTFSAPVFYSSAGAAYGVSVGDLNGDGKSDLVVAESSNVAVLLGRGDGTFGSAKLYGIGGTGSYPSEIMAVADWNNDGHPDVAVNNGQASFAILFGKGDGTFKSPVTMSAELLSYVASFTAVDMNGDGRLDLVTTNAGTGYISIFFGNGDGTFQAGQSYMAGTIVVNLGVADFNGDGNLDVAVANSSDVSLLLGSGKGVFNTPKTYPAGTSPTSVAFGDFNADGVTDLLTTSLGNFDVLLGNADGTYQAPVLYNSRGLNAVAAVMADFTGDGVQDLAIAHASQQTMSIFGGNGEGTFTYLGDPDPHFFQNAVVAGDMNGDGKMDLVITDQDGVGVLLGKGNGSFQSTLQYASSSNTALVVGDFNRDGKLDVASTGSGIDVFFGNGNGTLQSPLHYGGTTVSYGIATGDFNKDGILDLAISNSGSGSVSVFLGNKTGGFQAPITTPVRPYPHWIGVADFNGDGLPDIVVLYKGRYVDLVNTVTLLIGKGDGTFRPAQNYSIPGGPIAAAIVDINHDGFPDLILADYYDNAITVLLNAQ
jgi:FG-GAP-like repeat/FG-GAP repeat